MCTNIVMMYNAKMIFNNLQYTSLFLNQIALVYCKLLMQLKLMQ